MTYVPNASKAAPVPGAQRRKRAGGRKGNTRRSGPALIEIGHTRVALDRTVAGAVEVEEPA